MSPALAALLAVLAALFLLSRLRLGGEAACRAGAFSARIRVGPVRLEVYPRKRKNKTAQAPPKPRQGPKRRSGRPRRPLGRAWSSCKRCCPCSSRPPGG